MLYNFRAAEQFLANRLNLRTMPPLQTLKFAGGMVVIGQNLAQVLPTGRQQTQSKLSLQDELSNLDK